MSTRDTREPQLLVGVSVGVNTIHTIIVREEADGRLRLMGENRSRQVLQRPDANILIDRVLESINRAIEDAHVSQAEILAIGIAAPGQIDSYKGEILFSPLFHIQERSFPLVAKLGELIDVRHIALIGNDDAHGIGEQRIGEGRNIKDLIYIRVGYNIGACIIINEKLYLGADNLAGASGHIIVDLKGPMCEDCGNNGCLETLASRRAMERTLLKRYRKGEATVLAEKLDKEPLDINSAVIADAIDQEDALTSQVVQDAAQVLGIAIANVINFLNPRSIILGGDVVNEIDLYFENVVESAKKRSLYASKRNVSIVRGKLGTTAAAYGAVVFAKEHLPQQMEQ